MRPQWIERVRSEDRRVLVSHSRETIKNSPEWDPNESVSREYELKLYKYYASEPYWTEKEEATRSAGAPSPERKSD